jgi:hypothetical protein
LRYFRLRSTVIGQISEKKIGIPANQILHKWPKNIAIAIAEVTLLHEIKSFA